MAVRSLAVVVRTITPLASCQVWVAVSRQTSVWHRSWRRQSVKEKLQLLHSSSIVAQLLDVKRLQLHLVLNMQHFRPSTSMPAFPTAGFHLSISLRGRGTIECSIYYLASPESTST